ncbi:MAG: serine hydrolase domain-containing protein [Gemmatimonadaceae bacterium]
MPMPLSATRTRRGLVRLEGLLSCLLAAGLLGSRSAVAQLPTSAGAPAAGRPAGTSAGVDERVVDSIVSVAMRQQRLVGVSVALVRGGRVQLVKGYGSASLQAAIPVDTGTRFSIGSVTKEFVAALTLLLQEDRRLSVYDTLAKWYPALTRAREITLLDLVNHVSGYRDYYPLDFVDREMAQATTAEHIMREYATRPLDFDPGTRWSYSNTGYTILGRVLERVGGKPLGTQLEERIFRPLGMRQSVYEPTRPERRASGYTSWALGDPEPALLEASGWIGAPGGIWSTAADLARWDLALMRPGFLSPASRAVLFGERLLRDSTPTGYAGGLGVRQAGGRTIYQHGGATAGFSATNAFVPADTAAVVVLSNSDQNVPVGPLLALVSPARQSDVPAAPVRRTQTPIPPPTPRGPPALQAAVAFFGQLQRGEVDRSQLSADYAAFLTPERIASAARSLAPLGEVTGAERLSVSERGGMQVAVVRLTVGARTVTTLMYRSSDGAIEQYLLW